MKLFEVAGPPGAKYLYHATFADKVAKILKKGLIQFQTSNWDKGTSGKRYNEDAGVFAFEHPEDALKWAKKMEFSFKNKPTAIVKILREPEWTVDPSQDITLVMGKGKSMRSMKNVPPTAVVAAYPLAQFGTPMSKDMSFQEWSDYVTKEISK